MKQIHALLVGAALLSGAPDSVRAQAALPVVNLTEARRRSAQVDPAAVGARVAVATSGWERRSAAARLLTPDVTATTTMTRYNDPFFSFTGVPSATAATASFEARYTLLGDGKLPGLRRARAAVESAEAGETAALFRVALATDQAYFAVLAEGELSRVAAERLRRAIEQLGVARVRVSAGETIATDSLQLLLEVNRARLDVMRRDSALAVTRLRLGWLIGLDGPADAAPLDSAAAPALPISLENAIRELRETGPEQTAARAEERRAAAALGAERSGYLPDVTLSFAHNAYDDQFFPSFLTRRSLGLTISLPIWDGGRRELALAQARGQRDVARATRESRERGATEEMTRAWNGYTTANARIELSRVGVAVAAETYRVQGARYREGATTILDLLEAQVALSDAESELVQARYAARLALASIEALLGRRLVDDRSR